MDIGSFEKRRMTHKICLVAVLWKLQKHFIADEVLNCVDNRSALSLFDLAMVLPNSYGKVSLGRERRHAMGKLH